MAEEYYIRKPDDSKIRGPYTVEKLQSLAEIDQLPVDSLVYLEEQEKWVRLNESEELFGQIFPEKKKVGLRSGLQLKGRAVEEEEKTRKAVNIDEMLAAAEGETPETEHVRARERDAERAAALAIPFIGFVMLISALCHLIPGLPLFVRLLEERDFLGLASQPLLLVGILDLILAGLLFLGVTKVYVLVRIRVMIGFGYFGLLAWSRWQLGDPEGFLVLLTITAGTWGVFLCTLAKRTWLMLPAGLLGLFGILGYAWFVLQRVGGWQGSIF